MAECFNDIEVLWIARFDYKQDWMLSPHIHRDFYQLIYCIDGAATLILDNCSLPIRAPAILFFPPNAKHGFVDVGAGGFKTLDTKFRIHSRKLVRHCTGLPSIMREYPAEFFDRIYDLLEKIRENGNLQEILYEENCRLLLGQILIELIRLGKEKPAEEKPLPNLIPDREVSPITQKILSFVELNYEKRIDAFLLESEMHYSYRYLSRIFFREMNMTPVEFIEAYKVYKAKEMLKNTEMEIKYISELLSYSNVHQFSRSFKKNTGIPPARWRNDAWSDIGKDVVIHSGFENTLLIKKLSGGPGA
ncbi:helix-turn-helix domain-containing protein [Breznakiella homolactica]|uniref:Helix-turn-helix domain-containing protein n=1 Tax=Breznakiella homolactica TaxID=2798577 RepID=A0A7T7XR58_9SPIR|nr:AraC family transcriptional regulator [Breznakiella homolactica]QQO10979.1 AraC family transcriptional regulator [Breznakiella homolactica]